MTLGRCWGLVALLFATLLFFSCTPPGVAARLREEKLSKECPPWCMWSSEFTKCVCNVARTRCRCINAKGPWGAGWSE